MKPIQMRGAELRERARKNEWIRVDEFNDMIGQCRGNEGADSTQLQTPHVGRLGRFPPTPRLL